MAKNTFPAYLLLGSNLGDRGAQLAAARRLLEQRAGRLVRRSHLYETEPWGKTDQPAFLNQAVLVETPLSPKELMAAILQIERELGRERDEKWEARQIDVDILFYGDRLVQEEGLVIPHPRLPERNFALVPLMEIAAEMIHPQLQLTIEEIYWDSRDPLEVVRLDEEYSND